MPIHPDLANLCALVPTDLFTGDAAAVRAAVEPGYALLSAETALPRVEDGVMPGPQGAPDLPMRVYVPVAEPRDLPVTVFFHGGGFVIGGLDSHDALARRTAVATGSLVVAVDYRLAPEHPFPAAVEDAFAAYLWVRGNAGTLGGDPARVAVAGDSAGATLAATVCLLARDRGAPQPVFQVLWYPATGLSDVPSHRENADAPMLSASTMAWFQAQYLGGRSAEELGPYAAIGRIGDLSGLAPAHVVIARYDPLRDEGAAYAERLEAAGVPTTLERFDDMVHGFLSFLDLVPRCAECAEGSFGALRTALTAEPAR